MPLMYRAARGIQWSEQCEATLKSDANREIRSQLGLRAVSVLMNVECIVKVVHYATLNTPLEFVHTARRCMRVGIS